MKLKDFQLPRYFILNEMNLKYSLINKILNYDVEIYEGDKDLVVAYDNKIKIYSPTSLSKFLYNILYHALLPVAKNDHTRDVLSMGLFYVCKGYIYEDYTDFKNDGPPVLLNADKIPVPSVIVKDIIAPLVGKIDTVNLFFIPSNNTDACRIIDSYEALVKLYNVDRHSVPKSDYPILSVNCNVHNNASQLSHILAKWIEMTIGEEKTQKVLRTIFLDKSADLLKNMISVLRILKGDADFVVDFLGFLQSNAMLTDKETEESFDIQASCIQEDKYLSKFVKVAEDTYQNRQAPRQWSQWSMMSGLIEKQLDSVRGSMWPTSEKLGPLEKKKKRLITNVEKKKGKNQLNMEELLEIARDYGKQSYPKPGKIHETLLSKNRVWK